MFSETAYTKVNVAADMKTSSPQTQVLENAFYKRLFMRVYNIGCLSYPVIYNLEYFTTTVCNLRGHSKIYGTGFLYVSD